MSFLNRFVPRPLKNISFPNVFFLNKNKNAVDKKEPNMDKIKQAASELDECIKNFKDTIGKSGEENLEIIKDNLKQNIKDLEQFAKSTKDATEESIINTGSKLVSEGDKVRDDLQNTMKSASNTISSEVDKAASTVVQRINNVENSIKSMNQSASELYGEGEENGSIGGRKTRRKKSRKIRKTKNKKQRKMKSRRRGKKMHKKRRTMRKKRIRGGGPAGRRAAPSNVYKKNDGYAPKSGKVRPRLNNTQKKRVEQLEKKIKNQLVVLRKETNKDQVKVERQRAKDLRAEQAAILQGKSVAVAAKVASASKKKSASASKRKTMKK
jgi:hypothetical protein